MHRTAAFRRIGPASTVGAAVDTGLSVGTLLLRLALVVAPFLAGYLLYAVAMELVRRRERRETRAPQVARTA